MNRAQRETARLVKKIIEERKDGKIKLSYIPTPSKPKPERSTTTYTPRSTPKPVSKPETSTTPTHTTVASSKPVQTTLHAPISANFISSQETQKSSSKKVNLFEEYFGCFLISVFIGAFIGVLIAGIIFSWF